MARLRAKPPTILRVAVPGVLALWILLFTYLLVYTAPPAAAVALLLLPVPPLLWLTFAMGSGVSWEVDSLGFRVRRGNRVSSDLTWQQIRSVLATGGPSKQFAVLEVKEDRGRTHRLITGPSLGLEDLKFLYEAAAYYLQDRAETAKNDLGWGPKLAPDLAKASKPERPTLLPHVSVSLLAAGLIILATGSFGGQATPVPYGIALSVAALVVAAVSWARSKRKRVVDQKQERSD